MQLVINKLNTPATNNNFVCFTVCIDNKYMAFLIQPTRPYTSSAWLMFHALAV